MRPLLMTVLAVTMAAPTQAGLFRPWRGTLRAQQAVSIGRPATTQRVSKTATPDTSRAVVAVAPAVVPVLSSKVRLDSGLVIVPFAVPVAVPVATVAEPALFYSYGSNADWDVRQSTEEASQRATSDVHDNPAMSPPVTILRRHCAACHSGPDAKGHLAMFDESGRLAEKLPRHVMLEQIELGTMPRPAAASRLDEAEVEAIRRWSTPPRDLRW